MNLTQDIGKALLPPSTSSKALPAPAPAAEAAATTTSVEKPEPEPEVEPAIKAAAPAQVNSEPVVEAATAQVTSEPAAEQVITEPSKTEEKPKSYSRPLSPYASVTFLHSLETSLT